MQRHAILFSVITSALLAILVPMTDLRAGNDSCYDAGFEDGQDEPFSQTTYEHCRDEQGGAEAYYDGFIDGCMSVEGNTRDVCESETDA